MVLSLVPMQAPELLGEESYQYHLVVNITCNTSTTLLIHCCQYFRGNVPGFLYSLYKTLQALLYKWLTTGSIGYAVSAI